MANLYTKTGDKGQTSLVGGSRVSKSSLRVECYGTIDEANSMLGLAYAQTDREYIRTTVHRIQGRLFALGAELASDEQGAARADGKDLGGGRGLSGGRGGQVHRDHRETDSLRHSGRGPRLGRALHGWPRYHWSAGRSAMWWPWRSTSRVREVLAPLHQPPVRRGYTRWARLQEDLTQEERLRAQVTALVRKQLSAPEGRPAPL